MGGSAIVTAVNWRQEPGAVPGLDVEGEGNGHSRETQ